LLLARCLLEVCIECC